MSKLIVFDVDGTILDSIGFYEQVVTHYSRENGLPHPCLETIKRGYGDPHNHDFKWGVSRDEQVKHLYGTYYLADSWSMSGDEDKTPRFFEGVEEGLTFLKDRGHTLAIVTSKAEAPLLHLLEYHAMGRFFTAFRTSDDVKKRGEAEKPKPDQLLSVMRECGFSADDTVMVGDTTMDIHMGVAAGAHTIGVSWGSHPRHVLAEAGARHIVDTDFAEVARMVEFIFS